MTLANKRWTISYMGEDRPRLDFDLPAEPADAAVGLALQTLREALWRAHPRHPVVRAAARREGAASDLSTSRLKSPPPADLAASSVWMRELLGKFLQEFPQDDLGYECGAAGEAIIKYRGREAGLPDYVEGLEETEITKQDVESLKAALRWFVENHPEHYSTGTAIWALSKLYDGTLIPFFREQIREHYARKRLDVVQRADDALDRLGQDSPWNYYPNGGTSGEYWMAVEEYFGRNG